MTALCVAARVNGSAEPLLLGIREIASGYSDAEFVEMEGLLNAALGAGPVAAAAAAAAAARPPERLELPEGPPGILERFSPGGGGALGGPSEVELAIATTPASFAGDLAKMLPAGWLAPSSAAAAAPPLAAAQAEAATAPDGGAASLIGSIHDLLFVAMLVRGSGWAGSVEAGRECATASPPPPPSPPQEVDVQAFGPVCVAVAVVYLALRTAGLTGDPAATFWLVLAQRALHVDLLSVRECASLVDRLARRLGRAGAWPDAASPEAAEEAALAVARRALLAPPAAAAAGVAGAPRGLAHAPITAGLSPSIRAMHPATYRAAVAAEAVIGGADPEHAAQLVAAARGVRLCSRAVADRLGGGGRGQAKSLSAFGNAAAAASFGAYTTASSSPAVEISGAEAVSSIICQHC